jgi:hypothetical protein
LTIQYRESRPTLRRAFRRLSGATLDDGDVLRASSIAIAALAAAALGGCGSSSHSSSNAASGSTSVASSGSAGAGALSAEAKSAATGDIKDTQAFVLFHNPLTGYSIKYPEGWTQKGSGPDVSFSDKNNIVRITVGSGGPPSTTSLAAELTRLKATSPTLTFQSPMPIRVTAGAAIKATYTTLSAPNAVTGKSVQLIVDRYQLAHGGKRVTVDLGTAKGVDNVDAYRMMINSFAWQ